MALILLAFMLGDVPENITKIALAVIGVWHLALTIKHGHEISRNKRRIDRHVKKDIDVDI